MELGFESRSMDSRNYSHNIGPCWADSRPGSLKGGTGIREAHVLGVGSLVVRYQRLILPHQSRLLVCKWRQHLLEQVM